MIMKFNTVMAAGSRCIYLNHGDEIIIKAIEHQRDIYKVFFLEEELQEFQVNHSTCPPEDVIKEVASQTQSRYREYLRNNPAVDTQPGTITFTDSDEYTPIRGTGTFASGASNTWTYTSTSSGSQWTDETTQRVTGGEIQELQQIQRDYNQLNSLYSEESSNDQAPF